MSLFAGMRFDVIPIGGAVREFFRAKFTFVRFLSRVDPHVGGQNVFSDEFLGTDIAGEGFVAGVGSKVLG